MNHYARLVLHLLLTIVAGGSAAQSQAQWQTEYRGLGVQSLDLQLLQTAKQDWHANQLRYMMAPEWAAAKGGITREQAWTNMLAALPQELDNAHALGIAVIVDLHQLPTLSPNEPYAGDKEAQTHAWWTDDYNLEIMIDAWWELSQITAARPEQDIWLELYNEPLDWVAFPSYPANWPSWAQTLIHEIRTNDMAHPIVIQTGPGTLPWGLATWPGLVDPSTNDLIYSIHQYNPISYSHQGVSSNIVVDWSLAATGWDKNRIRNDELQYAKDYQDTHGVRIHVGEFSAPRWAPNAEKYLLDHFELFEEYGWDWNYHAFDAAKVWDVEYPEQVDLYDGSGTYVRTGIADPDEGLFYPPYGTPPLVALEKVAGFTERGELVLEFLSRNLDAGPVPGENLAITNGLWADAAVWDQGHVPDTTDDRAKIWANHTVAVDQVVTTPVSNIRLGSMLQNPGHLVIDPGAALTNNGLLQISGGVNNSVGSSVTIDGTYHNGGDMDVGHVSSTGQGGRLFINTGAVVTVDGVINVGLGSTGTVTMTGGTVVQYGIGNDGDTQIGIGERQYGELDMSGGTWTTGDDLIVGSGAGNARTGKAVLNGGATMNVTDDLFISGFNNREHNNGEVIVNDAKLDVTDTMYVGRTISSTGTLTLAHADAYTETWFLFVAYDGGKGTVNLLDGELFVIGNGANDNNIRVGSNGKINFEKGVLAWNDNTGTDELEQFWINGDLTATKSGANSPSFTSNLITITYSQDLGDGYTAWVGLNDTGGCETFVTVPPVMDIGDLSINIDGTDVILNWNGTEGANYTLQSKGDLTDPSWSDEQSNIPGVNGIMSATTTVSAELFYRVTYP